MTLLDRAEKEGIIVEFEGKGGHVKRTNVKKVLCFMCREET